MYQHVLYNGNIKNVVCYGINKYDNLSGVGTTHAEIDAINHLPPQFNKKKSSQSKAK